VIEIEYLPTSSLNGAPYNPRKMPDEQMARLMRGIEAFGLVDPIIVNQATGNIVGGHQRVEAAKRLKLAEVPVVHVSLDREQEKALNLALNKISGEWDLDLLRGILGDLNDGGFNLELTGFSADEIDDLLAGGIEDDAEREPGDPDDVPEVDEQAPPVTQPGDLILLGAHRLLCGDSTKAEDVTRLMDGALAEMVFTDPPYNVGYTGKTKEALTIENDAMSDSQFFDFLHAAYSAMLGVTKPGGAIYVCHADLEGANFRRALVGAGWLLKQCLIWVKQQFVMGRQDYHWQHEPILYGWAPGAAHSWHADRKQTTVWNFDRPQRNGEHPTMKPVELIEYALQNSSAAGARILDPFGGSGSTLIACEQTGRRGYLVELDPRYCDVIVARWENFTGRKAQRPEREAVNGKPKQGRPTAV
jgi:DNA modification methylase